MEVQQFGDGTPCWFELSTTDPGAAATFYADVLGWHVETGGPETGGYVTCFLGDRSVAGIAGQPVVDGSSTWMLYLRTSDLVATMAAVQVNGGSTVRGPEQVLSIGALAHALDPTGARIGFWQPSAFQGAGRVGEPGAYLWSELASSDLDASDRFYSAVAGLAATPESAHSADARQFAKGGHPLLGVVARDDSDDSPDAWTLTFMVTDLEDTLVRAVAGGAFLEGGIVGLPVGRHALVVDPMGARFGVLEPGH